MSLRICFLVGSVAISGGTYVIFQHAAFLRRAGHDVTLAVQEPFFSKTYSWHDHASSLRICPINDATSGTYDLVIATWWKTVFELYKFRAGKFAYFVQSIETRFYPEHEEGLRELVESTYAFPVSFITEASWIQEYLLSKHGRECALVRNGIRKDIYTLSGFAHAPRDPNHPRVLVEGHFGVPFKNTALAVRLVKDATVSELWVQTATPIHWLPRVDRLFSCVPMFMTPAVYRSCDILVKLSTVEGMFGPPLEMFHCGGTAIVFDVSGHDEYIVANENALVVETGDVDAVVRAISSLVGDHSLLAKLKAGAIQTASIWPSWDESSALFLRWVEQLASTGSNTLIADSEALRIRTEFVLQTYEASERERKMQPAPSSTWRYRLRQTAKAAIPASWGRTAKQFDAVYEVLTTKRKAF